MLWSWNRTLGPNHGKEPSPPAVIIMISVHLSLVWPLLKENWWFLNHTLREKGKKEGTEAWMVSEPYLIRERKERQGTWPWIVHKLYLKWGQKWRTYAWSRLHRLSLKEGAWLFPCDNWAANEHFAIWDGCLGHFFFVKWHRSVQIYRGHEMSGSNRFKEMFFLLYRIWCRCGSKTRMRSRRPGAATGPQATRGHKQPGKAEVVAVY